MAKLYFSYAAMNAGKSTALMQVAHNYEERGMRTYLMTAAEDDRSGLGFIGSKIGIKRGVETFTEATDLYAKIEQEHADAPLSCVLIDNAHWLTPSQVEQLSAIVDELRVPVLCYGLRTDFRGDLFPGSARLLAWADELREIRTVCHCGRKAIMTVRYEADGQPAQTGPQYLVGDTATYESLCRFHFKETLRS